MPDREVIYLRDLSARKYLGPEGESDLSTQGPASETPEPPFGQHHQRLSRPGSKLKGIRTTANCVRAAKWNGYERAACALIGILT